MKEWYSARELAGLPGLPNGKRNVALKARREDWKSRTVTGKGGERKEFHVSSLPVEVCSFLGAQEWVASCPPEARGSENQVQDDLGPSLVARAVMPVAENGARLRVSVSPGSCVEIELPSRVAIFVKGMPG